MSWGKIYETTWWGVGVNNNISWGIVYKNLANTITSDFQERVEEDGGIVEALSCLANAIEALPDADAGRILFDAYAARVATDLGLTEARDCTITEINNLL